MRRLLSAERHQRILERVSSEMAVDFASLAEELNVSSMTVRRDVRILEEQGYIKMTRGGASAQLVSHKDILINPRSLDKSVAKSQIGQYSASLIEEGEVIFLGTGSTTAAFAQFLPNNLNITVITPSIPHASLLTSRGVHVISTGGVVTTADMAQTGSIAEETIGRFMATRGIIGSGGVSKKDGLTEFDQVIADINRAIIANCEELMVLIDPSKAGISANYRVAPIAEVDEFVTTSTGRKTLERVLGKECQILTPEDNIFSQI